MKLRSMLWALALLASGAAAADADVDAEMKRIQAALSQIQAEQQTVYQQFQMVQELRRQEVQRIEQSLQVNQPTAQPRNYDDVVSQQAEHLDRSRQYADEANRLYERYRALEEQKKPLLDRLAELAQQR
jgi:cytochrome c556